MDLDQVKKLRVGDHVWDRETTPNWGDVFNADDTKVQIHWGEGTINACNSTYTFTAPNLSILVSYWDGNPYDLNEVD